MKNSTGASELVSTGPCKVPICEIITQEPLFTRNIQMEKTAWLVSSRAGSPLSDPEFQYSLCCPNFQDKVMNRKRGFVSAEEKKCVVSWPPPSSAPLRKKTPVLNTRQALYMFYMWTKRKKKSKDSEVLQFPGYRRGSRGYRWLCVEAEIHPDVTQHLNFQAQINASSSPTSQVHREEKGVDSCSAVRYTRYNAKHWFF